MDTNKFFVNFVSFVDKDFSDTDQRLCCFMRVRRLL